MNIQGTKTIIASGLANPTQARVVPLAKALRTGRNYLHAAPRGVSIYGDCNHELHEGPNPLLPNGKRAPRTHFVTPEGFQAALSNISKTLERAGVPPEKQQFLIHHSWHLPNIAFSGVVALCENDAMPTAHVDLFKGSRKTGDQNPDFSISVALMPSEGKRKARFTQLRGGKKEAMRRMTVEQLSQKMARQGFDWNTVRAALLETLKMPGNCPVTEFCLDNRHGLFFNDHYLAGNRQLSASHSRGG